MATAESLTNRVAIPTDPTAVIGRRVVAWFVDLVLYIVYLAVIVVAIAQRRPHRSCHAATGGAAVAQCLRLGDSAWVVHGGRLLIEFGPALTWFIVVYGLVQGLTGGTPGKLVCGLRVVHPDGRPVGIGASLLRSVLWIVDGFPYVLGPVVGGVAMVSARGHRRVGDQAADTIVVDRGWRGALDLLPPP